MLHARIQKEMYKVGGILFVVFILLTMYTMSVTSSLEYQIGEAEPKLDSMRNSLEAMYADHINLLNYIHGASSVEFSNVCQEDVSTFACQAADVREQIITGMSVDQDLLLLEHQEFTQQAITQFSNQMQELRLETIGMRADVMFYWQLYAFILFFALLGSGVWLYLRMQKLGEDIASPIDELITVSEQFVDGNYQVRAQEPVMQELQGLQSRFNATLDVIDTHITHHPDALESIQHLLSEHEQKLIAYVQLCQEDQRKVTFTDLKKHLGVTYPTLRKYVSDLVDKGLVKVVLEGREKLVVV